MSAEKIIKQIQNDAEKQIKQIKKDSKKQVEQILSDAKKQAKKQSETIINQGKKQSENIKKIRISQANQESKKNIMNAKEKIIETCFEQAKEKLSKLPDDKYKDLMEKIIKKETEKFGKGLVISPSKKADESVAKELNIKLSNKIEAIGGVILKSVDEKISIDLTFEGIINREKERIRIKVGKLLFSE